MGVRGVSGITFYCALRFIGVTWNASDEQTLSVSQEKDMQER